MNLLFYSRSVRIFNTTREVLAAVSEMLNMEFFAVCPYHCTNHGGQVGQLLLRYLRGRCAEAKSAKARLPGAVPVLHCIWWPT